MKKKISPNLLFGRKPVEEALAAGRSFDKIFIQKGLHNDFIRKIIDDAIAQNIPFQQVPMEKLKRLCHQGNHQGIAAFTALIPYYQLEDLLTDAYTKGESPLFLLCDGITDVGNFGAIARTAACTGVHGIVVPSKGSVGINAEAIKTSAGALNGKVHVCKVRGLSYAIKFLQKNGVKVLASSLQGKKLLPECALNEPIAFVLGSEGKGVHPKHLQDADGLFKIPMVGRFDSYNVSVATGMMLYETIRQRSATV